MSSPKLGCTILAITNLFKFVQQSLVADMQLLRSAAAVPSRPVQHFQDQLFFCFTRSGTRRLLEGYIRAVPSSGNCRTQAPHSHRYSTHRNNGACKRVQSNAVARPRTHTKQL